MTTHNERAEYQTNECHNWLSNDEPSYLAYINHLEKFGYFTASTAKSLVYRIWGSHTPDGQSIARVRWGEIAHLLNQDLPLDCMRLWKIRAVHNAAHGSGSFFSHLPYGAIVRANTRALAHPQTKVCEQTMFVVSMAPSAHKIHQFEHTSRSIAAMDEPHYSHLDRALNRMRTLSHQSTI